MNLKLCFLCVWACLICYETTHAQHIISGTIKDADTGEMLDAANVIVLRGQNTVAYAFTDAKGRFRIPLSFSPDTLTLHVAMMGYKSFTEKIGSRDTFHICLQPSPLQLKEVTIRPGRIWARSDTMRYDAARFMRENDKTVEDLMKRLPGIDVDEHGNIRYRGKDIGTMYVEGLDLMGNRYKGVSKNLSAQSVKEVEVLENHQKIKSLTGKVSSDITDINIKLKDDFKDKWNFNTYASAGISDDKFLYEAEAGALQIARKSQSLYALKMSNTGNGITKEMAENTSEMQSLPDYQLLPENSISAPIKEKRWLSDDAILLTGNRLYRLGEDSRMRFNASFTHDDIAQQTHDETIYFNPSDTVTVDEKKNNRLKIGKLAVSADLENNKSTHYLRNKIDANIAQNRMQTVISGNYSDVQRKDDQSFSIQDNFSFTRTLDNKNVLHLKSIIGYWQNGQKLLFANSAEPFRLNGFYSRSEAGIAIGRTKIAQRYTTGFSTDFNTLQNNHYAWITPGYEYIFRSLKFNLSTPLRTVYFPSSQKTVFLPETNFRTDYKINYAWNARFSARYGEETGNIPLFYTQPYHRDYRTKIENKKGIPLSKFQFYTLRMEYKNTLQEFFMTMNLMASNTSVNNTLEQRIENNLFYLTRHYIAHKEASRSINVIASKGFYEIGTKTSLELSYWNTRSAQLRENALLPFAFKTLAIKPTITVSPTSQTEITYNGELTRQSSSFGNLSSFNTLWNRSHKASFHYFRKHFDATFSAEYFQNDIAKNNTVDLLFLDFFTTYKFRKTALSLQINNLLNHNNYSYTTYNPFSVYSSKLGIRPREILISFRANL